MDAALEIALKQYESQKKRSAAYYERKKLEKIENGTYRGRGRPRKVKVAEGEGVGVIPETDASNSV
jgi:hypothetical protein